MTLGVNIEIPGLDAERIENQTPDIEINMGFIPTDIQRLVTHSSEQYYVDPDHDPPDLVAKILADGELFHFYYEYGVEFVFDRSATCIWGRWKAPLVLEDAVLYLLGPILGFMLRLRGITCLHASGVVDDGKAFALTGPSGVGKSTLAASFAAAGYPVLTDDVLPLTSLNDEIFTQSGYSRLRLFPNSFENLSELPDSLPLLAPGWDKCYLDLASDSYELFRASAALKVIYIIDWTADLYDIPTITTLSGATAVPLLAANTYRNELLNSEMSKREFAFLGQMVSKIQVKKLHPVDDISAIPQLREIIVEDFRKEIEHKKQFANCANAHKTG